MENVLTVIGTAFGILASWLITRTYYLKSLCNQREEFLNTEKEYRKIIEKFADKTNSYDMVNRKLLEEKRIDQCMEKYAHTGGGDFLIKMVDTYTDLSNKEKADLLDTALLRARGRKANTNPFRDRDEKQK